MFNIVVDTFGGLIFLLGLGLGLPAIAYEKKHPIVVACAVVVITVLGYIMQYLY